MNIMCKVFAAGILIACTMFAQASTESRRIYKDKYSDRMVPLLCEAIAFPTTQDRPSAFVQQKAWLERVARRLGLEYRDAGTVAEVELPGAGSAPVLGLVVHGDVQPPGDFGWTVAPFQCTQKNGYVYGRGAADDKGPMVQALLAMAALRDSGGQRTHTIRLLVGSDEESNNEDIATYLKAHKAPDLTLVLDSDFPVVAGEKAWDALELTAPNAYAVRKPSGRPWAITELSAGVAASIVPPRAIAHLRWAGAGVNALQSEANRLCPVRMPEGYGCNVERGSNDVVLTVTGRAAHAGMNIRGGRNALVAMAMLLQGKVEPSGAADLLNFAVMAGSDLDGGGLGLTQSDPMWGRYHVNVATVKAGAGGALILTTNLRRIPPTTHVQIEEHLRKIVADFNRVQGSDLAAGGYFKDEPFVVDPESKMVKRLLAAYERATGEKRQAGVAGGGTYARRLPNAVAFGMWFPGKPYPGHDVDERIPIVDLHRGVDVLLEALGDLAFAPPMSNPMGRDGNAQQRRHLQIAPNGYSHVVEVRGGRTLYIAGQLPLDADGKLVGDGDFPAQVRQVFANLEGRLKAAGATFRDVVKLNYYLTDASNVQVVREVRNQYIDAKQPPASTLVVVKQLARPDCFIEVEAIAVVPD